jgi:predicted ATPase
MELLFTWIEDYRNIKNQGINFSAEFNITFDNQTNVLSITKRQNYIPSFFGKSISNISVIVGENGTGKTSILNIGNATFYFGRNTEKYFVVCNNEELLDKLKFDTENLPKVDTYEEFKLNDTLIIHYSNFIDNYFDSNYNSLLPQNSFFEFSTNNIIRRLVDQFSGNLSSVSLELSSDTQSVLPIHMHITEIENQLFFLLKGDNHQKLLFKTPEILNIYFNVDREIQYLIDLYDGEKMFGGGDVKVKSIIDCFLNNQLPKQFINNKANSRNLNLKISEREYALFLLKWSMFLSFINSFSDGYTPGNWLRFDDNWIEKPIENWFNYFFLEYITLEENSRGSKYDFQIKTWAENAIFFVEQFEQVLDSDLVSFWQPNNVPLLSNHLKSYGKKLFLTIDISKKQHNDFLFELLVDNYQKIQKPLFWLNVNRGFLSFSWRGMSTGEIALLRIFSRFNILREIITHRREVNSINYIKSQITHLIFLIDEGEIGLHPTWQQQFLNQLIQNIPSMFEDLGVKSIQLILTTHSPFILSDVPNNHVIFLEKDKEGNCIVNKNPLQDKKMTFGANIHSLLSDGFFMKEGLMGDFAKKKINELIDDLIEKGNLLSDERKSEIKTMIPLIGEPIIRKKIMDLYNEQINLSIDDRIKTLEKDIEKLKAIKNDSNKKK